MIARARGAHLLEPMIARSRSRRVRLERRRLVPSPSAFSRRLADGTKSGESCGTSTLQLQSQRCRGSGSGWELEHAIMQLHTRLRLQGTERRAKPRATSPAADKGRRDVRQAQHEGWRTQGQDAGTGALITASALPADAPGEEAGQKSRFGPWLIPARSLRCHTRGGGSCRCGGCMR
jgi:hypothetical protein